MNHNTNQTHTIRSYDDNKRTAMNHHQPEQYQVKGHVALAVERWRQAETKALIEAEFELCYDNVADEQPVALVYNGISYAVMMATPDHLEDFALGFSLSEGLIQSPNEIYDIEVVQDCQGWLVNIELASQRMMELKQRRRNLAGRTGCGLCGAESIEQAIRPSTPVTAIEIPEPEAIAHALDQLPEKQLLKKMTGATHAASWCNTQGEVLVIREDLGRHNALDKLIGHLQKQQYNLKDGFALISSRASYEMVQKASAAGIGSLVAVSAPTSLAIDKAKESHLNLVGFARSDRFVIFNRASS
jgi:FdhD protein